MPRKARAEMLIPGDIVAMYAGSDTPVGNATIEEIRNDEFTPAELTPHRYITFWTTEGRYDMPADAELTVMAWAPMPEASFTGPNGKTFYYDGTPEDLERATRESELESEQDNGR